MSAASSEMQYVRHEVSEAEELYSEASQIVAKTPSTSMGAAILANPHNDGGRFYKRERAFQASMSRNPGKIKDDHARDVYFTIGNIDSFLYGAVAASLGNCNAHDARLNLKVARAILDEGRRALASHSRDGFEPPQIEEEGASHCH
ncbi:MAG: hypothetical protein NVSMB64_15430 [Candidatus Velthaea sp.]